MCACGLTRHMVHNAHSMLEMEVLKFSMEGTVQTLCVESESVLFAKRIHIMKMPQ